MDNLNQLTSQEIARRLFKAYLTHSSDMPYLDHKLQANHYREAAVLAPLVRFDKQWHLLYIRRSCSKRDYHSGQVAFAGGKRDPEDQDVCQTALREAHEEIGIKPDDVSLLGQMPSHFSISGFRIYPFVGHVSWPYQLHLQSSEVDRAFTIPLTWLANPENYSLRSREVNGLNLPMIYYEKYDGELLWGATARMTLNLLQALGCELAFDLKQLRPWKAPNDSSLYNYPFHVPDPLSTVRRSGAGIKNHLGYAGSAADG